MKPFLLPGDVVLLSRVRVPMWLCLANVIEYGYNIQVQRVVLMNIASGHIHSERYEQTFPGFDMIMRDGVIIDNRTDEED